MTYAFQEMDDLPAGFSVPADRKKPWGTGQAILACRGLVQEPFAVINADDYYGKDAFHLVHDYLTGLKPEKNGVYPACMAGFILKNTLSDNGGVTRGICHTDSRGDLTDVVETRNIVKTPEGAAVLEEDGSLASLDPECLVSMNMWGYTPDFMKELEEGFARFLSDLRPENEAKAEYLLPTIMGQLLKEGRTRISVLETKDRWFGVTYREDIPEVKAGIQRLLDEGVYPEKLWG